MKRLALIAPLLLTLAACATVHGAGQDLSSAGDFVADSAVKVEQGM